MNRLVELVRDGFSEIKKGGVELCVCDETLGSDVYNKFPSHC